MSICVDTAYRGKDVAERYWLQPASYAPLREGPQAAEQGWGRGVLARTARLRLELQARL